MPSALTSKGRYLENHFEKFYPGYGAILTIILLFCFPRCWLSLEVCEKLATIYLTIFSICFGFAFASVSTLLGLSDNLFIKGMRQSGAFSGLISYHWSCLRWCSLGTAGGIVVELLPLGFYQSWMGNFFIAIGIGALLSTFRIIRFFVKIIRYSGF